MSSFLKNPDGSYHQSYLMHMFYIASLGFNIVPGGFCVGEKFIRYESLEEGIKFTFEDGTIKIMPHKEMFP